MASKNYVFTDRLVYKVIGEINWVKKPPTINSDKQMKESQFIYIALLLLDLAAAFCGLPFLRD